MRQCNFSTQSSSDGCTAVVCENCGFSAPCVKVLPLRRTCQAAIGVNPGTAGTQLKSLLANIGFSSSANCKCNRRASYMNEMGDQWCEENIDTIVDWLREAAAERGLPFMATPARLLVKRAIHNARKEASRGKESAT